MTSKNSSVIDVFLLTHEDLIDTYQKLEISHRELKTQNESILQQIHNEISQKKVLQSSLQDLQSELDSVNENNLKKLMQTERKCEEFRERNQNLILEKGMLENKIDDLESTIAKLSDDCSSLKALLAEKSFKPRISDSFARSLEIENDNLRQMINELKEQLDNATYKYNEGNSRIAELTEKVCCLEDNIETKKLELDEKTETVEHLQEKLHEISSELALLKNSTLDENNRKGNSLFAEVDDQRQKMKKILQGERYHYLEMKKAYNGKEMEIRRLKRENINIKAEIQACTNILNRGEQMQSSHQRLYIMQLENDKKQLELQLAAAEEKLIDLAKAQKMHWIESILTTASKDTRDLKDNLYTLLREKTSLADNHSKTLKDLAKARLDSIKLKVFLGRLVDEFKIKINENHYEDIGLDEEVIENLKLNDFELIDSGVSVTSENKEQDESMSGTLNESTIVLLGGREKLGFAVPPAKRTNESDKENANFPQPLSSSSPMSPQKSHDSVAQQVEKSPSSPLKEKHVQFSNNVATKVIDTTEKDFKESQAARKKPAFTVKRIIIPSRKAPKQDTI